MRCQICAVLFVVCVSTCFGWDSIGAYTHEKITDDAINELDEEKYPDVHRFAEMLRDGSETEAHGPPGTGEDYEDKDGPTDPHAWFPGYWNWWQETEDDRNQECAVESYENHNYAGTYLRLGYYIHLRQDREVPAHEYIIMHGLLGPLNLWSHIDALEGWADDSDHYGYEYDPDDTDWQFTDNQGNEHSYWLKDSMDDDDHDEEPDPTGGDADDRGFHKDTWGVPNNTYGTYGGPPTDSDQLPGNWEGEDVFGDYDDSHEENIAHKQLFLAKLATLATLRWKSESLPPLLPDDDSHGSPSVSVDIFGPNKPVDVSFVGYENRKKTILVEILADGTAITDSGGQTWDGGSSATCDLPEETDTDLLPWHGTVTRTWAGELENGDLSDGEYTLSIQIKDQDGNESEQRTVSVKYDKTKPTGSISVNYQP